MELKIENVGKIYPNGKEALKKLNMTLTPGVYGLLGSNGAGKSTLMNIITDNLQPTSGAVFWEGMDIHTLGPKYLDCLGYMPQQQGIYQQFTARRFLWYMAALKGVKRSVAKMKIEELLTLVNLTKDADKRMSGYSGGMKQRALIAQALLNDPQILILDEPTAGLDPMERIRIRNIISEMSSQRIVILATHIVSDIESIAGQVMIMKQGELIASDTPENLIETVEGHVFERCCNPQEIEKYQEMYGMGNVMQRKEGQVLRLVLDQCPPNFLPVSQGIGLEDVYLYYNQ